MGHETPELPSPFYSLDSMGPLDVRYLEDLPAIELALRELVAEIDTSSPTLSCSLVGGM
jgi:hypothetical protein